MSVSQGKRFQFVNIQELHHNFIGLYNNNRSFYYYRGYSFNFFVVLFQMACSNIRFGAGVTREIGMVKDLFFHPKITVVSSYTHTHVVHVFL